MSQQLININVSPIARRTRDEPVNYESIKVRRMMDITPQINLGRRYPEDRLAVVPLQAGYIHHRLLTETRRYYEGKYVFRQVERFRELNMDYAERVFAFQEGFGKTYITHLKISNKIKRVYKFIADPVVGWLDIQEISSVLPKHYDCTIKSEFVGGLKRIPVVMDEWIQRGCYINDDGDYFACEDFYNNHGLLKDNIELSKSTNVELPIFIELTAEQMRQFKRGYKPLHKLLTELIIYQVHTFQSMDNGLISPIAFYPTIFIGKRMSECGYLPAEDLLVDNIGARGQNILLNTLDYSKRFFFNLCNNMGERATLGRYGHDFVIPQEEVNSSNFTTLTDVFDKRSFPNNLYFFHYCDLFNRQLLLKNRIMEFQRNDILGAEPRDVFHQYAAVAAEDGPIIRTNNNISNDKKHTTIYDVAFSLGVLVNNPTNHWHDVVFFLKQCNEVFTQPTKIVKLFGMEFYPIENHFAINVDANE